MELCIHPYLFINTLKGILMYPKLLVIVLITRCIKVCFMKMGVQCIGFAKLIERVSDNSISLNFYWNELVSRSPNFVGVIVQMFF
jgi:hypothetical protein